MTRPTLRPATLADAPWIIARHQSLYSAEAGFDASFGPLVSSILTAFFETHDPQREAGWIATMRDIPLACIFCMSGPARSAKLRLFLLEPALRGTGLAQTMLETCISFARAAAYPEMQLWTHESHRAAGRLYARNGFRLTDSQPTRSFGQDLIAQTWVLPL